MKIRRVNENIQSDMKIEIKEFMINILKHDTYMTHEDNKKFIKKVENCSDDFYNRNWCSEFFWELLEIIDEKDSPYPYTLIDQITTWTDMDHGIEVKKLIIKRKSDGQLFGIDYEDSNEFTSLYMNSYFKPVKEVQVTTTTYEFDK